MDVDAAITGQLCVEPVVFHFGNNNPGCIYEYMPGLL